MNIFKSIYHQWRNETPKVCKWIRNVAGIITAALPSVWMSFTQMGIQLPDWFSQSWGWVCIISLTITGVSGCKETANAKAKRLNKKVNYGE